jgi:hypothetical protein
MRKVRRALRDALKAKAIETTHAEALELIAKAFGYENWNILSAKIEAAERPAAASTPLPAEPRHDPAPPKIVYCSFCGKSQHQVLTVIAGPSSVFLCDKCVDLCTDIVEPDKYKELFELVTGTEESGRADSALLERDRGMSTEELAFYVERGRKARHAVVSPCNMSRTSLRHGTVKRRRTTMSRRKTWSQCSKRCNAR